MTWARSLSKVAVHSFVENLFKSIWGMQLNKAPLAVKYFFDFLDGQAESTKVTDPDVLHIWKTNRYRTARPERKVREVLKPCLPASACVQPAPALLGQHPEEPAVRLRHGEDATSGRLPVRHRSGLHGLLLPQRAPAREGRTGGRAPSPVLR